MRAVFLDRDGTIIEDEGYLADASRVRLVRGVDALRTFRARGMMLVVVSNQSASRSGSSRCRRPTRTPRRSASRASHTGRDKVLFFDGKYHGHFDETLVVLDDGELVPEEAGLPRDVTSTTVIVPFNDLDALRAALETREVAVVITEPVLTNEVGLQLPVEGFHDGLRAITRETGTLLAYDETHTQVVGAGGLTRTWGLSPDVVTIGKSIAGGVPLGAYGMTPEVAETLERPGGRDDEKPVGRHGRHALRRTRSRWRRRARRWARCSRPRPTRTRRSSARSSPTGSRR